MLFPSLISMNKLAIPDWLTLFPTCTWSREGKQVLILIQKLVPVWLPRVCPNLLILLQWTWPVLGMDNDECFVIHMFWLLWLSSYWWPAMAGLQHCLSTCCILWAPGWYAVGISSADPHMDLNRQTLFSPRYGSSTAAGRWHAQGHTAVGSEHR